jgi:hypothetical protein
MFCRHTCSINEPNALLARPDEQTGPGVKRILSLEDLIASWQLMYPHGQSLLAQLTKVKDIIPGINADGLISTESFAQSEDPAAFQTNFDETHLGRPWDTPFSTDAFRYLYDSRNFYSTNYQRFVNIRHGFASIPVIDLGAGSCNVGYKIANLLDSTGYVGVEPYHYVELLNSIIKGDTTDEAEEAKRWKKYSKTLKASNSRQIPFNVVAEDALSFLKRVPDLAVGVFSFGTDNLIISNADYIESVKEEIKRVLHPDSLMICDNTVFNPQSSLKYRGDLLSGKHPNVAILGR